MTASHQSTPSSAGDLLGTMQAALRDSEARWRMIADNTAAILFALDRDGVFTLCEGKGLAALGLTPGAAVGLSAFKIYEDLPEVVAQMQRALAGEAYTGIATVAGIDFETHWTPLLDENGAPTGALGVSFDVTERRRVEEALAQERDLLHTLIDTMPDFIYFKDAQSRFTRINRAQAANLGVTDCAEAIGTSDHDYYPRELADELLASEQRIIAAGEPLINAVEDQSDRAHTPRWLLTTKVPIMRAGQITGIVGISRDITDLKQMEEGLRESEQHHRRIVETAQEGIWMLDACGASTFVNQSLATMLGYTVDELLGAPISAFMDDESHATIIDMLTSESAHAAGQRDLKCLRKDGTVLWAIATATPIRDAEGHNTGALVMVTDITARKQAEDLRVRQARHAAMHADVRAALSLTGALPEMLQACAEAILHNLYALHTCIWTCDEAGNTVEIQASASIDPAVQFGYSGLPIDAPIVAHIIRERRPFISAHMWSDIVADGTPPSSFAGYPLLVANRPVGMLALALDQPLADDVLDTLAVLADTIAQGIERRRGESILQAKEEAERANRAKNLFLSRMSHELRTPLNAILGFAQVLEMEPLTPAQQRWIAHILKGGRHLLDLINEVLDIARIEADRLSLSLEPVPIDAIVAECVEMITPLATQRNIELYTEIGAARGRHVRADQQRLKQALLNLLSNAAKYNRIDGSIRLSASLTAPGRVRLAVNDTGPGIAPEKLELLFTPFERLGAETTSVEGTGLGLALSKGLVEAMDGMMGVESVPGTGSTFWIDLPLVDAPAVCLDEHDTRSAATAPSHGTYSLLYIEDNLSNVQLIETVLAQQPGISLHTAMQGRLGLELAQEYRPDAILLDLNLPDLPGLDVLRRLSQDERMNRIPVVISADATPGQIDRLLAAGARAYLTKPLDVKTFLTIIADLRAAKVQ